MTDKARRVLSAFIKSSSPEDWLCLEMPCGHYCKFFVDLLEFSASRVSVYSCHSRLAKQTTGDVSMQRLL